MSTSGDLREALTQRLKKIETRPFGKAPSGLMTAGYPKAPTSSMSGGSLARGNSFAPTGTGLPSPSATQRRLTTAFPKAGFSTDPSLSPSSSPVVASIHCEGYLSKYSSGSLTGRWQRRYFVLQNGRLGYYNKAPNGDPRISEPDKSFSLRKVKEIVWNESSANEREFVMRIGDSNYQLKATTPSEMRKWVSAINTAIAQKDSLGYSEGEDNGSSSAVDLASVSNSVSSVASDSTVLSEDVQAYLQKQRQMAQASAASRKFEDTVWEVEVDPDELDKFFIEWFSVGEEDTLDDMTSKLVKGLNLALSHLYSTIGSEMFDAQTVMDLPGQLKRARSVVQSLRKSSASSTDPIKTQINAIFMEYLTRMIGEIVKYLEIRKDLKSASENELLTIIDFVGHMMTDLSSFMLNKADCVCAYCSPIAGTGESCVASDRWRKTLRNILQRLGSEFEVTLIEKIQDKLLSVEDTWEAEPGSSSNAPNKVNHALFGSRLSVWMSGWSAALISTCEREGFALLKQDSRLRHSKRLVSELVASVLVAVLNSAWRQCKRRCMKTNAFAEVWRSTLGEIAHLKEINTGFWSIFSSQHHEIERLENSCPIDELYTLNMTSLISFGNEAVLLSTFLSESVPEQLPYTPKIFESCFEGLSVAFSNTAAEMAAHAVHFHFVETNFPEVLGAFKSLTVEAKKTPMIVVRDTTEKFASDLVPFGCHPSLKSHILNILPAAVIHLYVSSLMKTKPKLKAPKSLATIADTDLIIFKSLFSEIRYNCKDTVVNKAMFPLSVIHAFLTERNKQLLIEESARKLVSAFGAKYVVQAATALLEMRGLDFNKQERAALMAGLDPGCPTPRGSASKASSLARLETASYLTDAETVWRF
jgi:hypothetical protein